MPRDRKAIEARKRRERQEAGEISKRNEFGYADMKKAARATFPEFDGQALDAARFFFGVDSPQVEVCEGERLLSDILQVIPAGQRNSTLSHEAGRLLTRYGDTPQARQEYDTLAGRCSPALDVGELDTIWRSAQGFYHTTIEKAPGYVRPRAKTEESATP